MKIIPIRKRLTPAQRERILAAYRQSSLTQPGFARQYHIGTSTLRTWLRQSASKPPSRATAFLPVPKLPPRFIVASSWNCNSTSPMSGLPARRTLLSPFSSTDTSPNAHSLIRLDGKRQALMIGAWERVPFAMLFHMRAGSSPKAINPHWLKTKAISHLKAASVNP